MANLSTALDLLRQRLESHTPQNDPDVAFTLDHGGGSGQLRDFAILWGVDLAPGLGSEGDPTEATIEVEVSYPDRGDEFEALQYACNDAEDLTQRINYYPGAEWALSSGFDFRVTRTRITAGALRLTVEITYNQRT